MTAEKPIDFGSLADRTFDGECFKQLWEIVAPPGGSIHTDPGLQHILVFRKDGAWLNPDWIVVEEFSLTSPVDFGSGPVRQISDLPRDARQKADDAESIHHRRTHDFTRWSPQLEVLKSAQKADQQPRVPFPFSACDLAAFMLHGPGAILAEAFGGLEEPEPDLRPIGGLRSADTPKGEALRGAWKAVHLAEQEFGHLPRDAQQLAAALPLGAPNPPQEELDQAERAYKKFRAEFPGWLTGMVKCLVEAASGASVETALPIQQGLPVEAATSKGAGLSDPADLVVAASAGCAPRRIDATAGQQSVGSTTSREIPLDRRMRRRARFIALDGGFRWAGDKWALSGRRGALADLVREEQRAGRPMAGRQDVTRDLLAVADPS